MADIESWKSRIEWSNRGRGRPPPSRVQPSRGSLTDPDPKTGEQWEAGQVWGHLAEFIQFWIEQAGDVIDAYRGDPIPFGRTRADPSRLAGIEQGGMSPSTASGKRFGGSPDLRGFLAALPEGWQSSVGLHPTLGPIPSERVIDQFLIAHLEEHAAQLEGLARGVNEGLDSL